MQQNVMSVRFVGWLGGCGAGDREGGGRGGHWAACRGGVDC